MAFRDELPPGQPPVPPIPPPPVPPPVGGGAPPPQAPAPPPDPMGANPLGNELIGDIPPPPNAPKIGGGDKHGVFAVPGTSAAIPFRTPAFAQPGAVGSAPTPSIGGGGGVGSVNSLQGGVPGEDAIAELLKRLAMQQGGGGNAY